jgi:hypothetical protein
MQENAKLESGTLSAAKLAANRANARLSCGPKTPEGKARSSRNSTKHGLTRRTSWAGECPEQNEKSFQRAWDRSGPRDAMEETCVASLLQARSRDDYLLDAERTLLTRRPVMATLEDVPYPFLYDPDALNALDQLGRQDAHFARVFEKDVAELLTLRKNKWATPKESVAGNSTPRPGNAQPGGEASCEPIGDQETADPAGSLRALEEFLGDRRVLLPGEDFGTYEALARGLWTASQPGNLLEELVVGDIIRVQWRLDRVLQIEQFSWRNPQCPRPDMAAGLALVSYTTASAVRHWNDCAIMSVGCAIGWVVGGPCGASCVSRAGRTRRYPLFRRPSRVLIAAQPTSPRRPQLRPLPSPAWSRTIR